MEICKGEVHLIERLTAGETYTLREEMAPYGYLMAEEITFTVEDTEEIQKVEMKDAVPTGTLIINKKVSFWTKYLHWIPLAAGSSICLSISLAH